MRLHKDVKKAVKENISEKRGNILKNTILLDRRQWGAIFFFICFGWIAYQTFRLAKPFLPGLLGAAMLGLIFSPLYRKVLLRVKRPNIAAAILTASIMLRASAFRLPAMSGAVP